MSARAILKDFIENPEKLQTHYGYISKKKSLPRDVSNSQKVPLFKRLDFGRKGVVINSATTCS